MYCIIFMYHLIQWKFSYQTKIPTVKMIKLIIFTDIEVLCKFKIQCKCGPFPFIIPQDKEFTGLKEFIKQL